MSWDALRVTGWIFYHHRWISFSSKPLLACHPVCVGACDFNFRLNHLPVRFLKKKNSNSKNIKQTRRSQSTANLPPSPHPPSSATRWPRARRRRGLRRRPTDLRPRRDDFQRGNVHDLRRAYLMYVLVTSSRLRGLQVQTCVSTHAVTGRTGAEPSYEPRCFISCELRSGRDSQLEVCFSSAAQRWADGVIRDEAVGKRADLMRVCPRAVDDVFIEQQPKVSNENRNKKNKYCEALRKINATKQEA